MRRFPETQEDTDEIRHLLNERMLMLEKLYSMISDKPWPDEYSLVLTHLLEDIEENEKALE